MAPGLVALGTANSGTGRPALLLIAPRLDGTLRRVMVSRFRASRWASGKLALVLLPAALVALLAWSSSDRALTQQLFTDTTYYLLMTTVLCWAGTQLYAFREMHGGATLGWVKEHWPGLLSALVVTLVVGLAVTPALRVLSDEANLLGVSKNLFASKTATFTVSGKYYYDSYWDIDVAIDQRPTLFPFLVALVHTALGYSYKNVFLFNLLLLPAFVLASYLLAKSLGGERFGVVASLLAVAHPITMMSIRSGGFDFCAALFALLVIKSLFDYGNAPSPAKLAVLWMNLCLFAQIRYETALFIVPVLALLLLSKLLTWSTLRPYAFVYALTPAYFLPRVWQSLLRGNVPVQEPGTVTFSVENFLSNLRDYFKPILSPWENYPAHSAILIGLGVIGALGWLRWLVGRGRAGEWRDPRVRFALFVLAWLALQAVITFSYVWGRAQYPSAARLLIAFDTFFSFAAAWTLTRALARWRALVAILLAAAVLALGLPEAGQHRMFNRLTQTRENATTWSFFERLNEKRIVIVTDRPNHFTIMNYGAMNFETARNDPYLFTALTRRLFYDVYVIQPIRLSTNTPLPGYELWPTRPMATVLEFQNDADVLVRISRVVH